MGSILLVLGFAWLALIAALVGAVDPSNTFLGISPFDEQYFKSEVINCKDESNSFVRARLNDGFCDCEDGTDEPDCCDEYDGAIKCLNMCWEAGEAARDKLKKKIATFQEGATVRKQKIEQSKLAIAKEEEKISSLRNDEKLLHDLVENLKEIEKAEEEEEHLKKEKEAQKMKEAKQKENEQVNQSEDTLSAKPGEQEEDYQVHQSEYRTKLDETKAKEQVNQPEETSAVNPDEILEESFASTEQHVVEDNNFEDKVAHDGNDASNEDSGIGKEREQIISDNTEGLSKEELGRLVASCWTGRPSDEQAEELDHTPNVQEGIKFDMPEDGLAEEYDGYQSDGNEHDEAYSDDMDTDIVEEGDEEDEEEHDDHGISESPELHGATDSDATSVRKEYDDYNSKLQKIQSRISSLSKKLKADFGMPF